MPDVKKWLGDIEPVPPQDDTGWASIEAESTIDSAGYTSIKASVWHLRHRRILMASTDDPRLEDLKSFLTAKLPPGQLLEEVGRIRAITMSFIQRIDQTSDKSVYNSLDDFLYLIDEAMSKTNRPIMNRGYFEADIKRCESQQSDLFQRSIMINIINPHWLDSIFDWNIDGQWSQPIETRLPSRDDYTIAMPKPDFAISFTLQSFLTPEDDSDPIPAGLLGSLSPDSAERCFPFLFFEVRKTDIQDAYAANLHSASQALYNMHTWMVRAGCEDLFLEQVRVFSVVFSAPNIGVRVHRAVRSASEEGELSFQFDELKALDRCIQDEAYLLIRVILSDYGRKELHAILKKAFMAVSKLEQERIINMRQGSSGSLGGRGAEDEMASSRLARGRNQG